MDHIEENLDERQEDEVEALKSIYDLGLWDILPSKIDLWRFDEILSLIFCLRYLLSLSFTKTLAYNRVIGLIWHAIQLD